MKRKLYLILALLVALVLTGGTFAYTASVIANNSPSSALVKGSDAFAGVTAGSAITWTDNVTEDTPVDVPATGTLFTVTGSGDYTGTLQVTVYLTNTDELAQCYQFLNMNIAPTGGSPSPSALLLTLENGEVSYTIASDNTTPSVIGINGGGGHTVLSFGTNADPEPDFWCEVVPIGDDTTFS